MSPRSHSRLGFWMKNAAVLLVAASGCANAEDVTQIVPPGDAHAESDAVNDAAPEVAEEAAADVQADKPQEAAPDANDASVGDAADGQPDTAPEATPDVTEEPEAGEDAGQDAAEEEAGCPVTEKLCDTSCVAKSDPAYGCDDPACTPCVLDHATAGCASGTCSVASCENGYADCDSNAANGCETPTDGDPQHCGSCTKVCSFAHAGATCVSGTCTLGACDANFENCDNDPVNGCEGDLMNNPNTCGTCTTVCTVQGGTPICTSGVCGSSGCNAGLGDCDPNQPGCETNITTSVDHCGYCNHACTFPNATATCVASQCKLDTCATGFLNCDGVEANGCEVNTQTDAQNCGGCNQWCGGSNVIPTCTGGSCQMVCVSGFGDCNGVASDGCETTLNTAYACGSCTTKCLPANGVGACNSGNCGIQACNTGFGDCNNSFADGCETNVYGDIQHCGTCSTVCSANHGAPSCNGLCQITCDAGWANCNGVASDGCEAATTNDPNRCGSCNTVCQAGPNSTATCTGTTCGVVCNAGWADCDGNAANGCEVNTETDPLHCGSCTTTCATPANGTAVCALSACGVSCNAGFGNCDGSAANGCEANLSSDSAHCGTCSISCGTASCVSGTCSGVSCTPPQADCDGLASTGCEANLNTDPQNCGQCGKQCSGSQACSAGSCVTASHINCIGADCTNTLTGQNLGQTYTNASAVGVPGNATTYNQQMATDAANAWMPGTGTVFAATCTYGAVIAKELSNACAVWTYGGANAGQVHYSSVKYKGNYCYCTAADTLTWR